MSPFIEEGGEHIESGKNEVPYFTIDLLDGAPFDTEKFDDLSKKVDDRKISRLKFLVINNKMFIFIDTLEAHKVEALSHVSVYESLPESLSGKLQCAGKIKIDRRTNEWNLTCGSISLSDSDYLDFATANQYKETVLKSTLGDYFKI